MPPIPTAQLVRHLAGCVPADRIFADPLHTLAYGTDASFYRLIPQVVVNVETEDEVTRLLAACSRLKTPLTFRAAGTSLSGQAVTDAILATLGHAWRGYRIAENGALIRLQPGVVGAHANAYLAPYGRKIGPDPASINSAMIGGIAANNASGMCCGTAQNSYRTLAGMRIIFADGTLLDTLDEGGKEKFRAARPDIIAAIDRLSSRVRADAPLAARIRRKFSMKNTTGYSLNALVDFTDPIEIIQHLMIGSEGTLGFIAEVALHTVPEYAHKATALLIFSDIAGACEAVSALRASPLDAVELMDRASLRSVESKEGMPPSLKELGAGTAALLVETRAADGEELARNIRAIGAALEGCALQSPCRFTDVPDEYALLWNIRKGLFPSVGAMRRTGTTCIIEDVAFPVPQLAAATLDLRRLFGRHGYGDAIIFGHAREGNLHFVFNQDFNAPEEVDRYARFMDDLTRLVATTYDGSLKAEHGTGRNMAPFVELEWGAAAYALMKEIKHIFDPDGLLNPGVLLNDDRTVHLKHLKPLPAADPIVDKCIECGFCEVHCPSKDLTLTPRQRIVVTRELARLTGRREERKRVRALRKAFAYEGDATCATDGLCAVACPVAIDTGTLIKDLRRKDHSWIARWMARYVAQHVAGVSTVLRGLLSGVALLRRVAGERAMALASQAVTTLSLGAVPSWNRAMPGGAARLPALLPQPGDDHLAVVYFPSCITRTFGPAGTDPGSRSVPETTIALLGKAGFRVIIPRGVGNLCCGMAFESKGFAREGAWKAEELREALAAASENGRHPVLMDMSPCLYRMKEHAGEGLRMYDPAEFTLRFLTDRLRFRQSDVPVAVHVTCSAIKMGLGNALQKVAHMCATHVVVPLGVECCGWAGDRGFTVPALNASALRNLREEIPPGCAAGYSTSRTCEIGLTLHSGIPYRSIMDLVDRSTTALGVAQVSPPLEIKEST
jgi:D-lactate dehydrogenase